MSEETLPAEKKPTDLTDQDIERVNQFIEEGKPGIAKIDDTSLYRMIDLYLTGSTYSQISNLMHTKKSIILYLAYTNDWYIAKRTYLNDLNANIKARVIDAKLLSQDFMLKLSQAWQKKIGSNVSDFLRTGDPSHMNSVNLKEVEKLMKLIEMIDTLNKDNKERSKNPTVGLNLGDGVTIEKTGDNKVTITPKENTIGDMLKKYADARRQEEQKIKHSKSSDITNDTQGENNENE